MKKRYVRCLPWAKGFVNLFLKGKMLQSFLTRLEKTVVSLINEVRGNLDFPPAGIAILELDKWISGTVSTFPTAVSIHRGLIYKRSVKKSILYSFNRGCSYFYRKTNKYQFLHKVFTYAEEDLLCNCGRLCLYQTQASRVKENTPFCWLLNYQPHYHFQKTWVKLLIWIKDSIKSLQMGWEDL